MTYTEGTTEGGTDVRRPTSASFNTIATNYSAEAMVGLAETAATDGASVTYAPLGSVATTSSLTANNSYYTATDGGALTTTSTSNVLVGRALSSTKLLLKGYTGS